MPSETTYKFSGLDELYETAAKMPEVDRHEVLAHNEETDDWTNVGWRNSLWTDEDPPRMAGEVSADDDYYNIIQYGDILDTIGQGLEQHEDVDPEGHVTLTGNRHKMTGKIGLDETVEPVPGDEVEMQLHIRSGHSGYHGVKYAPGAERLICSNGMTAFVEDQVYEQTHSQAFQKGLAFHAVDSIVEGSDVVEDRLKEARETELMNQDEALLVLRDIGVDRFLENPTSDLVTALQSQAEDVDSPSLYDTYNAGTYALTHMVSDDVPEHAVDAGLEDCSRLLEYGNGLPDPEILGGNAVENRMNYLTENGGDAEEYWPDEREAVRELAEEHGITA